MSIRTNVVIACLGFLAVNMGLGLFGRAQQHEMGDLAIGVYDEAFVGVDRIHTVQTDFLRFAADHRAGEMSLADADAKATLGKLLDELDVGIERAMTDGARNQAKVVRRDIATLRDGSDADGRARLGGIDAALTELVNKYKKDGFAYRLRADDLIDASDTGLICAMTIAALLAVAIAWGLRRTIVPPLKRAVAIAMAIADGRLDNVITAKGRSETSQLLSALSTMQQSIASNLSRIEEARAQEAAEQARKAERQRQIAGHIAAFDGSVRPALATLASAAVEMHQTSESMSRTAAHTSENAAAVAAASEEASATAKSVVHAAHQLSQSIADIGHQVAQSADIAGKAVVAAARSNERVEGLSVAAQKIGEVVNLIQEIASQTNLLALNATIEAARAGDAGKGFAVVASEVKSLANQTAKATEDITNQIAQIQSATADAVEAIKGIGATIREINDIAAHVAGSVSEQGKATDEIARNTQQSAESTAEVAGNISGVSRGAGETGTAASQVLCAASELGRHAQTLSREIDAFLAKMRAA